MKLCLRCFRLNEKSAEFCAGGCGSLMGGARCPKGHVSPGNRVICCSHCGTEEVVQAVPYLNLSFGPRLMAWAVAIMGIRWGFAHPRVVWQWGMTVVSFMVGERHVALVSSLFTLLVFLWVLQLLFGRKVAELVPSPRHVFIVIRAILRFTGKACVLIYHCIEGRKK